MTLQSYHCSGVMQQYDRDWPCGKLLLEYEDNFRGTVYKKCPSCKTINQVVAEHVIIPEQGGLI